MGCRWIGRDGGDRRGGPDRRCWGGAAESIGRRRSRWASSLREQTESAAGADCPDLIRSKFASGFSKLSGRSRVGAREMACHERVSSWHLAGPRTPPITTRAFSSRPAPRWSCTGSIRTPVSGPARLFSWCNWSIGPGLIWGSRQKHVFTGPGGMNPARPPASRRPAPPRRRPHRPEPPRPSRGQRS